MFYGRGNTRGSILDEASTSTSKYNWDNAKAIKEITQLQLCRNKSSQEAILFNTSYHYVHIT